MNGRQVADATRQGRPNLKVLFVTSYTENAVLNHGPLDAGMEVITKPFDLTVMADCIRTIIPRRQEGRINLHLSLQEGGRRCPLET